MAPLINVKLGIIYLNSPKSGGGDTASFITTWRTTTSNESITIPTTGSGYNYTVKTSDGQEIPNITGNATITFATAGDYDVSISGDFPRIYINNAGDKTKLIDIKQWGDIVWSSFENAFFGCSRLTGSFTDAPNLTNVTKMSSMFRNAPLFNGDISSWDVSNVTNMNQMLRQAASFNQDLTNWDVSSVTSMSSMFFDATSFDQDLSNWDITSVTNFNSFHRNLNISTSNYDAILIGWEATLQAAFLNGSGYSPNINIRFGNSQYTGGGAAATARASLISNFGWGITDGGIA